MLCLSFKRARSTEPAQCTIEWVVLQNGGLYMIYLDSPMWKELDFAGSDADEILRDLMEGKGDYAMKQKN